MLVMLTHLPGPKAGFCFDFDIIEVILSEKSEPKDPATSF